jgi:hypothetical protein
MQGLELIQSNIELIFYCSIRRKPKNLRQETEKSSLYSFAPAPLHNTQTSKRVCRAGRTKQRNMCPNVMFKLENFHLFIAKKQLNEKKFSKPHLGKAEVCVVEALLGP